MTTEGDCERHLLSVAGCNRSVVFVSQKPSIVEIDCYQVRRELSEYLEDDVTPELRSQIEDHLAGCAHCTAIYDGMRNVVQLLGSERMIEMPEGFSQRLYQRLFRFR